MLEIVRKHVDYLLHGAPCADESEVVTRFSAGAGGTVFEHDVDLKLLKRLWQNSEYQFPCPKCGNTAYICSWAGHATRGDYWSIHLYCPCCDDEVSPVSAPANPLPKWKVLMDVVNKSK